MYTPQEIPTVGVKTHNDGIARRCIYMNAQRFDDSTFTLERKFNRVLGKTCLVFAFLSLTFIASPGCRKKKDKPAEEPEKTRKEKVPWPEPELIWKSEYRGTVRPMEIHGERGLAVSYQFKRHWAAPRRVVAFNMENGVLLWDDTNRPDMMVRTAPWSLSHAIACREKRCFLAYQQKRSQVYALDLATGDGVWKERGSHGVGATKDGIVLSEDSTLSVLRPDTGQTLRSFDLTKPETGALPSGVKSSLSDRSMIQVLDQGFLLTRDDGGELQLLDDETGKLKWSFRQEGELGDRVRPLPVVDGKLLVPAVFPDKERDAELAAWPLETDSAEPSWKVSLSGRVQGRQIKEGGDIILVRSAERGDREFLARIDRGTGKKLSRVQMPGVSHCVPGPMDKYFCRTGNDVSAFDPATGKLLWKNDLGSERKRVMSIWWVGQWVAAETAGKLWILSAEDGIPVTTYEKKLKDARIDINAVLGPVGDILPLVVRTYQESDNLDRRYLVGLNLKEKDSEPIYEIRLGVPTPTTRYNRIKYRDRRLRVPVVFVPPEKEGEEPVVFSAAGNSIRLIRAKDGEVAKAFKMPGDAKRPTALISEDSGVVILERGDLMLAIQTRTAKILWRKFVGNQELVLQNGAEALLQDIHGDYELVTQEGSTSLDEEFTANFRGRGFVTAFMTDRLFIARHGGKVHFFDREKKEITGEIEGNWYFYRNADYIVALRHIHRKGGGGVFVSVDIESGKSLWTREPGENPEVDPVPEPPRRERQWPVNWVRGVPTLENIEDAKGVFLVTDSSGKCVIALEAASGAVRWTICFGNLTGLPVYGRGYILLAAHGPALRRKDAQKSRKEDAEEKDNDDSAEESPPEGSQLYAINAATGEPRLVYTAPAGWEVFLGTAEPDSKGRLLITLAPQGRTTKKDKLAALNLWPEKSPEAEKDKD